MVTLPFIPGTGLKVLGGQVHYLGGFEFVEDTVTGVVANLKQAGYLLGHPGDQI